MASPRRWAPNAVSYVSTGITIVVPPGPPLVRM